MCGIAGLVRWSSTWDSVETNLHAMSKVISHRGPDDVGTLVGAHDTGDQTGNEDRIYIQNQKLKNCVVGLAQRRLSVIELSKLGHQPMCIKRDDCWIIYNGETYNFRELRNELAAAGRQFGSGSDTEVVIAAYEHWGEEFVSRCNGMFAMAIYDQHKNKLLLYRDRVGIKPLFIHQDGSGVSFASELKSLLAGNDFERKVDPAAITAYLDYQIVNHRPETFLQNVSELAPGHMMRIDLTTGKSEISQYYNLGEAVAAKRRDLPNNSKDLVPYVRENFIKTVRSHLVADVRVGSCLSGGLDSSSIVCAMDKLMKENDSESASLGEHITTFSSCHKDRRFDEQEYIDEINNHCNTKPIKIFSTPEDLAERFDKLVWHQDEPFTSPSIFAQFLLMEAARKENVTVLLDGQGGDEIFAGYRKFFFFYMRDLLKRGKPARFISEMFGGIRHGDGDLFNFKAMRRYMPRALRANTKTIGRYLKRGALGANAISGFGGGASIIDRQMLDIERYSLPSLLRYEDRNSMAFGIEARVPFLDHHLIETGIALPIETKIKGGVAKNILREAMRGLVPDKIIDRRTKMGFVTPEQVWMRETLRPLMEDMFSSPQPVTRELVDLSGVEHQYRLFVERGDAAIGPREFFRLLCLDRWIRLFNVTGV